MRRIETIFALSALTVSFLLTSTNGHTMGLGSCARVEPVKDFSMDKMLGEWFVIQKFATSSSCMKYNFTKGDDGKLRLVQTRQHFILDTIGVDHVYTYTGPQYDIDLCFSNDCTFSGVLSTVDPENAARMRVKFPLNIAGDAEFVVFMTDYTSYAGIFTCQRILFGHTKSATILSRTSTLDKGVVNQIRQKLSDQGVDVDDFSIVEQSKCISKEAASFNVKIDDKTFSPGNVAGVVKKVGGAIGTGVEIAGDVLGTGIAKAANVTGGLVETLGEQYENHKNNENKDLKELLNNAKIHENDAEWLP